MEEAKAKLTEINLSDDPAVTLTIRLIMQGKVGVLNILGGELKLISQVKDDVI